MDTANELTLRRETVLTAEKLLDTVQEQSVELDYVLPDYYPDFFRLLSCTAEPTVTRYELQGGMLVLSLCVRVTVWYLAEGTPLIQVITQKLDYQKQIPWGSDLSLKEVRLRCTAEPSYINCRAVNSRRMDIRGAVRVNLYADTTSKKQVLSDISGLHTQCRTMPVQYISEILRSQKRCTLSEDFAIPASQSPLLSVLRENIAVKITETRPIAGKLVVKGELAVSVLYTTAGGGVETLAFSLPLNQILEPEGLSDEMPCSVRGEVTEYLLTPQAEQGGDFCKLHLDIQLLLSCEAMRCKAAELVSDVYSTVHPVAVQSETVPLLTAPVPVQERLSANVTVAQPDTVLSKVYAAWCTGSGFACGADENGSPVLQGTLNCSVLAADAEGMPLLLSHTETVSLPCNAAVVASDVTVQHCTYTLTAADTVALQVELLLCGNQQNAEDTKLLSDVQADADTRLQTEDAYALRLYFAQAEESLWEIAKRYHTAANAIMEENDCRDDILTAPQMLLIPIVR